MSGVSAKICGLQDEIALEAAILGGASYVGFVFFPPSRHAIKYDQAQKLAARARDLSPQVQRVGLFADAQDDEILQALRYVQLDLLQLHGHEPPQRIAQIKAMTGLGTIKALRMMKPEHLDAIATYEEVSDLLLFDSRIGNEPSGGPSAWDLLKNRAFRKPWLLAGGLTATNLEQAVRATGAGIVDVSSGVEDASGRKNPEKIKEFLALAASF
ncbi:MAG: phosphoribosylanthranilate isomerase [Bdellovibrionales bacterium]